MSVSNQRPWGFFIFVIVILLLAAASYRVAPGTIGPIEVTVESVLSLFGLIFVITLFVERAQEVVLTNWRARGSEELDLKILGLERQLNRLNNTPNNDQPVEPIYAELERLRIEKLNYRSHTRVLALRVGVIFGVAVSMAGVRTLGVFVPLDTLLAFSTVQQAIFHCVDVIITGGVVAGGSDGVHKMAELYRVFVETKAKEEKSKLSPLKD